MARFQFDATPFAEAQGVPPNTATSGFFRAFAPILPDALSRYDTDIINIAIPKHDGIIPVIRLHQRGRT
jgi:hypothetical protein